ncbi:MAG: hypothetical protein [Caudoviricetes sp.]|nr:MAG: hypothetical protein [Caudoviricetes sp.]
MTQIKQSTDKKSEKPIMPAMLKQRLSLRALDLGELGKDGMTSDQAIEALDKYEAKCKADIKKYGPEYEAHADEYIDDIMREIEARGKQVLEQQQGGETGLSPDALQALMDRVEGIEAAQEQLGKQLDDLKEKLSI